MLVIRFGPADLANVRFAISPLVELHRSIDALDRPGARALHLPWIVRTTKATADLDLELLRALQPENVYTPDFVHPPPRSPLAGFEEELAEMMAVPEERVRTEIEAAYRAARVPAVLRGFIEEPAIAMEQLADLIHRYWERALAPYWDRLRRMFEEDILYRARRIADGGAARLFSDLHPEVRFEQETLLIDKKWQDTLELDGRGLLFVPSAFTWPKLAAITQGPWQPTLIYPARGVGTLWEPGGAAAPDALAALLGDRRAAVLVDLDAPRSTTELARRLALSPASVSQHLTVLRGAGLVDANRVGRVVLYARTARGDSLATG